MHYFSKVADGLAAWLRYEMRCGRRPLFSEDYLALPVAQLLRDHYPDRLVAQVKHPIIAEKREGTGRKPSIDFGVPFPVEADEPKKTAKQYQLLVETKWLSKSNTLLRDIIRDLLRLAMLIPEEADEGAVIVAGRRRNFESLFKQQVFKALKNQPSSKPLLPMNNYQRTSIRFVNPGKYRSLFYKRVLEPYRGLEIPSSFAVEGYGPYPKVGSLNTFQVYVWKIRKVSHIRSTYDPKTYFNI